MDVEKGMKIDSEFAPQIHNHILIQVNYLQSIPKEQLLLMKDIKCAEQIRKACIKAAKDGFLDASMSGLCTECPIESMNPEKVLEDNSCSSPSLDFTKMKREIGLPT